MALIAPWNAGRRLQCDFHWRTRRGNRPGSGFAIGYEFFAIPGLGAVNIRFTEFAIVDKFFCASDETLTHGRCHQPAIAGDLEIISCHNEGIELVMPA